MAVYFMQSVDGGPVKIGTAVDVDRRRDQLEATYGTPLAVLATIPGSYEEEKAIHNRFSHLRLGRTEQFRPAADLMSFISLPLLVSPNPDAVEAMPSLAKASIASLKGSDAYRAWLEGLADHSHLPMAILIEHALREYAEAHGYKPLQPRR